MKPIKAKPVYFAIILPDLQKIARDHGYNAIPHGSFGRDFDIVCIAWIDKPEPRGNLLKAFADFLGVPHLYDVSEKPENMFHHSILPGGRHSHVIHCNYGYNSLGDHNDDQWYLDISFTPQI